MRISDWSSDVCSSDLRPGGGATVAIIESKSGSHELKILVKGYEEPRVVKVQPQTEPTETADDENDEEPATPRQIATHLFSVLRGSNNLIFPTSRREGEGYTTLLHHLCGTTPVPKKIR